MIELIISITVATGLYIYIKDRLAEKNKVRFDILSDRIINDNFRL